ncbi:helix-turn-helix domain-containing protein [Aerococcaceae bacterium zg-ZUI334]|uniref:Rgg family transcriptional regulator n=1 Tax=Aerococcaceae bacterium zg-252 TaxID=2796928 RepID=UPI001BA0B402|nr:helix-turn-helix domain-containing protein [Aerococcaceae bacterium zg-ZUI334]
MEIGEVLRSYRRSLGLTQQEMAANILTTSYYSKVEKGYHRISAEDLFEILDLHGIKLLSFYEKYQENKNESQYNRLMHQLFQAYYKLDSNLLDDVENKLLQSKLSKDEQQRLRFLLKAFSAMISQDFDSISEQDKIEMKNKIFDLENWSEYKLSLYANIMVIYDIEANQSMIGSILSEDLEKMSSAKQAKVLSILINFIMICFYNKEYNLARYYIKKIKSVTTRPQINVVHKLMNEFYHNFLEYKEKKETVFYENMMHIITSFELIDATSVVEQLKSMFHGL